MQLTESLPPRQGLQLNDSNLLGAGSFIDGSFSRSRSSDVDLIVTNPANGGIVRRVVDISDHDVKRAATSAETAFQLWRLSSLKNRSAFLRRWHTLVMENREDLAHLITLENGKPLSEARVEVDYAASFIDWNVLAATQGRGSLAVQHEEDLYASTTHQPIGVCLVITPWNFPAAMIVRKVAPALAAGCAVVAKPSDLTPLTALALAELASRAGAPRGLFNVLATTRAGPVSDLVLQQRCIRMLSFTGSTRVGKLLAAKAGQRLLKTSLELGGHAPFIVYDDADVEAAVDGLMKNKFRVAGQTCIAANRVFVQRGPIYHDFCTQLTERMASLVMGNGLENGAQIGPLISEAAVERVTAHVDDAVARGATLVLGGTSKTKSSSSSELEASDDTDEGEEKASLFFPPTLLLGVTDDMLLAKEETFGPVVGVLMFTEEREVIRRANDNTEGGLASYVYTSDAGRALRASKDLSFGMVGVNETNVSNCATPFGGMKESGLGREGGVHSLEAFTEVKYALMRF